MLGLQGYSWKKYPLAFNQEGMIIDRLWSTYSLPRPKSDYKSMWSWTCKVNLTATIQGHGKILFLGI